MSITVVDRQYITRNHSGGNDFPLANSGQIVEDRIDIVCEFDFQSTINEQVIIVANNKVRLLSGGSWSQKGFVVGDNVGFFGVINTT
ncbi:hypothetical protein ACI3PL_25335, partial [Lacticaseibacillus paracasei]